MAEKTPTQQLAEKLLYKPAYVADKDADVKQKAHAFAEGYKKFLDNGKTEREVAAESEQMLKDAGYVEFDPKKTYQPGDKVYFVQFKKAVVASTIGTRSFEDGFRLVIAHTDSPRLDLRPTPLYESDHLSYFKTHYYGGIRKYQWGTMPLSIHGVFTRDDGTTVTVRVGEDEGDPVFCITDLLPHLSAEQNTRTLKDGIKAEELNILIGSDAVEDEDVKEAVKLNTMILLHEKYGITEKEFMRAEIEITPAYKCRDVGFDRSMVGGYGHDDRVDAYPALMAEIETKAPAYTTVCVLTDKEEIGSDGVTGMQSMYAFHFMQELCRTAGQDDILAFRNSVCLSADVTAAYDPSWASAFEPMNGTYAGRGVAIFKYTGGGSKGSASDACATDVARPIFMGTFLDVQGDQMTMVATDTHRLALKTATLDAPVDNPLQAVIPSRLLSEISRQLPTDIPETVEITAVRNYLAVQFGNVYIRTRLIEGEFPNYRRVIPSDFKCIVTVDRAEFTGAVERASIVAKDAQYNVINFIVADDQIKLMSQHPDYGTVEDYVPCHLEGQGLDISFNGKFILDILKHCHDSEVILKSKENSPMLVQDKEDTSCVFVVTPMRTK